MKSFVNILLQSMIFSTTSKYLPLDRLQMVFQYQAWIWMWVILFFYPTFLLAWSWCRKHLRIDRGWGQTFGAGRGGQSSLPDFILSSRNIHTNAGTALNFTLQGGLRPLVLGRPFSAVVHDQDNSIYKKMTYPYYFSNLQICMLKQLNVPNLQDTPNENILIPLWIL